MLFRIFVALAFAVCVAGCASSDTQPPDQMADGSEVICKREKVTGSHRSTRVCRTQAEIDASREASKRAMDTRRSVKTTSGG